MKRILKRAMAVMLTAVMLLTAAPLSGFAGLDLPNLADLFTIKADAATKSGKCGSNLTWSLDTDTGVLTISGTGDMYNWSLDSNAPWYSNRSSVKTVVIGDSVTSIGDYAFYRCTGLTSVTIPDSVTSIGGGAFRYCDSLTSITIPDSVTSIGRYAFEGCTGLTSVTIPDSVTGIRQSAFYNTGYYNNTNNWENNVLYIGNHLIKAKTSISGDYLVKFGTKTIADYAFYDCTGLTSVTIPGSVTSIGYDAFEYCTSLTSVTIGNSVTSIGYDAFRGCTGLTSITIGNSVTSIGGGAFRYCDSLTSITIPDSVTSIGLSAFEGCTGLTSVTIPDSVTGIGDDAFDDTGVYNDSSNWENNVLYIGNHLIKAKTSISGDYLVKFGTKTIADSAFEYCKRLTSITIGNSVTSIGDDAFYNCTGLTSVTIPDSVTSIGDDAFYKCTGLTSITVKEGNPNYSSDEYGVLFNKDKTLLIQYPIGNTRTSYTIPDSVTSIGDYAFGYCTSLISVTIPDSVTIIGDCAFGYCTSLTSVTIPDSVTIIGESAFWGCAGLTSVTIPDSVTSIGDYAFYNCTGLTSVTIPDSVTSIGYKAFLGCTGLTSVTIGNSVTSIGEGAFLGCTGLTSVTIPDSVTIIGDYAFGGCTGLTSVTIPDSVTIIGDDAFLGCTGLTSVTIPDSVTSIGDYAFYRCTGLTSVTIPDSVTSIGGYAFYGCKGLTSIVIPDSVTSISYSAFEDCTGLTSVTIGNSVTSIGESAFEDCTGLTSVTIGNSVTSIGDDAFAYCTGLTYVYYTGSKEDWNKISIGSNNGYLTRATIHYLGSELSYTQTHTVNNYSKKNTQYASNYLISAGTALDGQNSTPSTVIPGLKNGENMVPQGIAYYKNKFLITSYFNDASGTKKPSMIFVINSTSGKLVKEYKMRYDDGENSFDITGHVGGIAVSGDNIYVADGKYIYYIKAKNMNNGIATATARKKISGMNGFSSDVSCSYVTITDGILWTGNFYDGYDSRYKKPANSSNNSVVLGFSLNGMGDETEWQAFNQKTQPDVKIDIPDKIENIQCATVYNKKLILTTSFGRKNTSKLYVTGISDNFKFMDSTTNTFTGLPMMEGSVIKDGYMYGINESGAYYYNGYAELSKDPTDVVWKYNLGKILNMDITASTDGDVVNKSAEFVDGKTGTVNEINFKQSWFMQDSMEYNHQLAILCSQYAMIGYDNVDDKKPNLEKALSTLGMSDIEIQPTASRNQVNYFLANRKINVSGKQYTLIFAGFIGSYHDQWYSNFDPGIGDTHQGFNSAKEYVYGKLENYINKLGVSKDDTKILITGHSRGAATANLVAAKLIKEQKYASASNVYTYAFATPNSTKLEEKDNAEYKRIFNFVNPEDFVTKCMPASWGYGRYGTTFVLPSKTNTTNYSKYKDKMQSYFYQFSGEQEYKNYITGEAAAYTAVKSLTALVRNVDLFYALPLLAGTIPMTTYAFFQNTLCHFVSHTASALDFAAAGAIIVETLGMATSCFAYRDILNYFITNGALSSHFADSHSATTYCAFVSSMSSADMYYRSGFLGSVNCPVDVEVYDKTTGELVGRIVDNAVDETIAAKENSIVMTVDGESKQYWLPSDGDFEVKLIGNDNGTMDYSVAAVDSDTGETERVNFFDVDIVKGQAMTGEVNADEFSLEKYTLEKETGETVEPTEQTDDIAEVEIKTSASGNGTVSESTTATSGDYVTVYATPDEGYVFKGWYDGDKLVSTDAEYSFVAKENTSLTARFEPAEYTATLMVDGKVYKEITYTYGQKSITLPEVPAKAGFKGEWESYSLVAGGVTINAIYTALPRVNSVSVDDIEMNYKNSATLNPVIDVDEGVSYTVTYTSSNPSVARVDENGNVYGAKKGSTEITVTVTDEYGNTVSDTCKVNVTYAWWQWIIVIVLFGWIWY